MLTLNTNKKNKLKYIKNNIHEDNLKAMIYMECKLQGINILLEYQILNRKTGDKTRCDAVILDQNKDIVALIEVKGPYKKPWNPRIFNKNNRQFKRYRAYITINYIS